jgi:midasin
LAYFKRSPSLFERLTAQTSTATADDCTHVLRIIETAHRLLRVDAHEFSMLWNWAPMYCLLTHPNQLVRWHASMCIATLLRLNNAVAQHMPEITSTSTDNKHHEFLRRVTEDDAILQSLLYTSCAPSSPCIADVDDDGDVDRSCFLTLPDFGCADILVDVCGLLLEYRQTSTTSTTSIDATDDQRSALALTTSTQRNLRALALAVSHGNPILLEGVTGAGKTALIDELARVTNNTGT